MHAGLWTEDLKEQFSVVSMSPIGHSAVMNDPMIARRVEPASQTSVPQNQLLLGNLVSPCHVLSDLDGNSGLYFVFSDIRQGSVHFCLEEENKALLLLNRPRQL